jgi:hypothetical protein
MRLRPAVSSASVVSNTVTPTPQRTATSAIPDPICPAPITPTRWIAASLTDLSSRMVAHRNKTRTGWRGGAAAVNPGEAGGHNLPATNLERLDSRLWTVVKWLGIRRGHRGATRVGIATRRGRPVEMNRSATPLEDTDITSARGPRSAQPASHHTGESD